MRRTKFPVSPREFWYSDGDGFTTVRPEGKIFDRVFHRPIEEEIWYIEEGSMLDVQPEVL